MLWDGLDVVNIFFGDIICIIRVQPRHLWPQTHICFFTSSMNSTFGCQVILASKSLASSEPALVFRGNILQLREHLLKEGNLKRWEDEKFSKGVRGARGARIGLVPLCFFFWGGVGAWEVGKWHLKLFLLGGKVWLDGGLRVEECHHVHIQQFLLECMVGPKRCQKVSKWNHMYSNPIILIWFR